MTPVVAATAAPATRRPTSGERDCVRMVLQARLRGPRRHNVVMSPVELELAALSAAGAQVSAGRYAELARRAKRLSWLSLGAMAIEGGVAVLAGVLAGSVALVGFGLDSAIEGFASTIIIWRFTGSRVFSQ